MADYSSQGAQDALVGYDAFNQAYDTAKKRREDNTLRSLAQQYVSGADQSPNMLGQIAANGGDPSNFAKFSQDQQANQLKQVGQIAGYLASITDVNARNAAYQQVKPRLVPFSQQYGLPLPDSLDESHLPEIQQLAQTLSGEKESWSNAGNGYMISNTGGSKQIPGYQPSGVYRQITDPNNPDNVVPALQVGKYFYSLDGQPLYGAPPLNTPGPAATAPVPAPANAPVPDAVNAPPALAPAASGSAVKSAVATGPEAAIFNNLPESERTKAAQLDQQNIPYQIVGNRLKILGPDQSPTAPTSPKSAIAGSRPRYASSTSNLAADPPATIDYWAHRVLSGDKTVFQNLARSREGAHLVYEVKNRIPSLSVELKLSPQDSVVQQAVHDALADSLKDNTKWLAAVSRGSNQVDLQSDVVTNLLAKGAGPSGVPALDRWIQAGRVSIAGDADVNTLNQALNDLATQHTRVQTGPQSAGQLNVDAAQVSREMLNIGSTPATVKQYITLVKQESANSIAAGTATNADFQRQIGQLGLGKLPSFQQAPAAAAVSPTEAAAVSPTEAARRKALLDKYP